MSEFRRELGLFDSVMVVAGVMIGSGIFIVSADMARLLSSAGWLLAAWLFTGFLTASAALSYGELAAMMPEAGGMYVYLKRAFSPLWGFLYGWTLFTVIQTGTIAAVAVAFARFSGVLFPAISESAYWIPPVHLGSRYAISMSTAQFVAILVIALLSWTNSRGIRYGKIVQNVFTTAKIGSLVALIGAGLFFGRNTGAVAVNSGSAWPSPLPWSDLLIAICLAQVGSLFSADSWHNITFAAGEVKNPQRNLPLSLALGTSLVIALYVLANLAYLSVLPLAAIQNAPADRVATAMLSAISPLWGAPLMAAAIMVSTFGCVNALVLSGPRVYFAMAADKLFFARAARLNQASVPDWSLWMQGAWSALLVLPRTIGEGGSYGNLYSNLLDYVISAALIFYIMAIAAVFRMRLIEPDGPRPYRTWGYPMLPAFYILGAAAILASLFVYRPATTWPGLLIVLLGVPVYVFTRRRS
jgi:APA family basic amino acid/polyamine antiporter